MSNSNVWAIAGGPFDNGDPGGLLMERGGFYQCQFSFRNGNGYGIFTPDSYLGGNLPNTNQTASTSSQQTGIFNRGSLYTPGNASNPLQHNANRSVFYFRGVSYVGGCFGFVDNHSKEIQGVCNGSSNETITQQTLSQNTGGLINASQSTPTVQPLVINARGNIVNVGWTGRIVGSRPVLRFRGEGEMTVAALDSDGGNINNLAFEAYSGLIDAIVSSVSNSTGTVNYDNASGAIQDALADLTTFGAPESAPPEVIPVRVTGNRRFF